MIKIVQKMTETTRGTILLLVWGLVFGLGVATATYFVATSAHNAQQPFATSTTSAHNAVEETANSSRYDNLAPLFEPRFWSGSDQVASITGEARVTAEDASVNTRNYVLLLSGLQAAEYTAGGGVIGEVTPDVAEWLNGRVITDAAHYYIGGIADAAGIAPTVTFEVRVAE